MKFQVCSQCDERVIPESKEKTKSKLSEMSQEHACCFIEFPDAELPLGREVHLQ